MGFRSCHCRPKAALPGRGDWAEAAPLPGNTDAGHNPKSPPWGLREPSGLGSPLFFPWGLPPPASTHSGMLSVCREKAPNLRMGGTRTGRLPRPAHWVRGPAGSLGAHRGQSFEQSGRGRHGAAPWLPERAEGRHQGAGVSGLGFRAVGARAGAGSDRWATWTRADCGSLRLHPGSPGLDLQACLSPAPDRICRAGKRFSRPIPCLAKEKRGPKRFRG